MYLDGTTGPENFSKVVALDLLFPSMDTSVKVRNEKMYDSTR